MAVQQALHERRFDVAYDHVYDGECGATAAQVQALAGAAGDPAYFGVYFGMLPITEKMGKAARMLGVRPTPFEEGLKETWRWYLRNRNGRFPQPDFSFENRLMALVQSNTAGQG